VTEHEAETDLIVARESFIAKSRTAAQRCAGMAAEADKLGFTVLAREYDYYSTELPKKIQMQLMALESELLK
jgi:hypothetical protein